MNKIAGFCNLKCNVNNRNENVEILKQMNNVINNLGKFDYYLSSNIGLLSPSYKINANGNTFLIVFNGELYNKKEVKSIVSTNSSYKSFDSDAQLVLSGFLTFGPDFIKHLNGSFSFVIWDDKEKTLYMFRDFIGIKPLYYTIFNNSLIFSSKISSIFKYKNYKASINKNSFKEIFGLGPAKTQGNGIFENIKEVLPAHYIIYKDSNINQIRYWQFTSKYHKETYLETVDYSSYLLKKSIRNRLSASKPLCSLLSGGLDSSIISFMSADILGLKDKVLDSYSFDFEDNNNYFKSNSYQPSKDRPYVDIMVNHINSNHIYLECSKDDLIESLYDAVDSNDLPNMADIWSSLLYFCKIISKNHKIALTGECADEIFGGYPWFYNPDLLNCNTFPWSHKIKMRTLLLKDDFLADLNLSEYIQNSYEKSIKETPLLDGESVEDSKIRQMFYINFKWFMYTLVERMDKTSSYFNLTSRAPFADKDLIEYLWNVPWSMKYSNNKVKGLLKDIARPFLPNEVISREKSPYPKTYNPSYEIKLGKILLDEINCASSPLKDIVDISKLENFINSPSDYSNPWFGQLMAGPQLIAYFLQINYWMKKYL